MKKNISLKNIIGKTDIYLIDQIMKERYQTTDIILDAGCGDGRNMFWFLQNEIEIYGMDSNNNIIQQLQNENVNLPHNKFQVATVENIPFSQEYFHHIICIAVLHFAKNKNHFFEMMTELVRVLKPKGSLFIRIASDIGLETKIKFNEDGVYTIPDGTNRFLLTKSLLQELMNQFNLSFLEPLKTVNVNDERCMSTLVLQKN